MVILDKMKRKCCVLGCSSMQGTIALHKNKTVEETPSTSTIQILGIFESLERMEETALYNISNSITKAITCYFQNCETCSKNVDKIPSVLLQLYPICYNLLPKTLHLRYISCILFTIFI